jgi:proteasome lid subunit RPN8/RPN11
MDGPSLEENSRDIQQLADLSSPKIDYSFRSLKNRLMPPEKPPLSWNEWEQLIIEHRSSGLPISLAPKRFLVNQSLLDAFHNLLPLKKSGQLDKSVQTEEVERAILGDESDRSLVVDEAGKEILVVKSDLGFTEQFSGGSRILHIRKDREIGGIHTHPKVDSPASSGDIRYLLSFKDTLGIIVAGDRVRIYIRTNQSPYFGDVSTTQNALEEIRRKKGREILNHLGTWNPTVKDLEELHILTYDAMRGSPMFERVRK